MSDLRGTVASLRNGLPGFLGQLNQEGAPVVTTFSEGNNLVTVTTNGITKTATTIITLDQFKNSNTSPVSLLPKPTGTGMYVVDRMIIYRTGQTLATPLAGGGSVRIIFHATTGPSPRAAATQGIPALSFTDFTAANTFVSATTHEFNTAEQPSTYQLGLSLETNAANWTGGTPGETFKIVLIYHEISL